MRKITRLAASSFIAEQPIKIANTRVKRGLLGETFLYLHNNLIAHKSITGIWISNAGWQSNTTKERLNGLPGVSIYQKRGRWYLNGEEWNGEWTKVAENN